MLRGSGFFYLRRENERLGDINALPLGQCIQAYAGRWIYTFLRARFPRELAKASLPREEFVRYFSYVYGIVVWFNKMLATTIPACETVHEIALQRQMMRQLAEEEKHNELYRDFLEALGVDHEAIYQALLAYFGRFTVDQFDQWTDQVLNYNGPAEDQPKFFPDTDIPDSVLALCHYLKCRVGDQSVPLTDKLVALASIEIMLCRATTRVYPGMVQYVEEESVLRWFAEHRIPAAGAKKTLEQVHLEKGIERLDARLDGVERQEELTGLANEVMNLYLHILAGHYRFGQQFPVERYMKEAIVA